MIYYDEKQLFMLYSFHINSILCAQLRLSEQFLHV